MAVVEDGKKRKRKAFKISQEDAGNKDDDSTTPLIKKKKESSLASETKIKNAEQTGNTDNEGLTAAQKRRKRRRNVHRGSVNIEKASEQETKEELTKKKRQLLVRSETTKKDGEEAAEGTTDKTKKKKKRKALEDDANKGSVQNANGGSPAKKRKRKKKGKKSKAENGSADTSAESEQEKPQFAIDYLKQWKEDRSNWKFVKLKQIWLNRNFIDDTKVPDDIFPIWIEYMEGSTMGQKKAIVEKATQIAEKIEKDEEAVTTDNVKYQRARMIIQQFSVEEAASS